MNALQFSRSFQVGGLLVMTLALGCGKAEYEASMNQAQQRLKFGSKFIDYLHGLPSDIRLGTASIASLQLPLLIDERATTLTDGAVNRAQVPLSPQRIHPPFVKIPGFQFSYEKWAKIGQRDELPLYVYFGVVDATKTPLDDVLRDMQTQVQQVLRNAKWSDVTIDTPDMKKLAWKKMSIRGNQPFEHNANGGEVKPLPGRCDLYVHSTQEFHIIIGFRAPDEVTAEEDIFTPGEMALGTLQF